jgi:hypothetical protein
LGQPFLERYLSRSPKAKGELPKYGIALIYLGLGETDESFRWLAEALQERDDNLLAINLERRFDPLRDDPRFQDLLLRMNLEP